MCSPALSSGANCLIEVRACAQRSCTACVVTPRGRPPVVLQAVYAPAEQVGTVLEVVRSAIDGSLHRGLYLFVRYIHCTGDVRASPWLPRH